MAVQLSARKNHELVLPHGIVGPEPPMKIACGSAHSLFLATRMDDNELADESERYVLTTVMGFGANRHNPLALKMDMESEVFEASHGDIGVAPWKVHTTTPTEDVFVNNDPVAHRAMRKKKKGGKQTGDIEDGHGEAPQKKLGNHKHEKPMKDFIEAFEVACGNNHSMVLEKRHRQDSDAALTESRLWSFGMVAHGRLGRDKPKHFQNLGDDLDEDTDLESEASFPDEVFADNKFHAPGINPTDKPVVQRVCCGADHTLAIVNFMGASGQTINIHGRVFAWGLGSYGALGTRKKEDAWVPKEVFFPGESAEDNVRCVIISQVACGSKHSMGLASDGMLFSWGHAGNGRLGLGRSQTKLGDSFSAQFEPQNVEKLKDTKTVFIAAGESHSGCCDQLGGMYTWGEGSFGRCGHGMNMDSIFPARVESLLGTAIGKLAMGMSHTLAVSVKGQLYSWGKGPATGLDKGDNEFVPTPLPVNLEGSYNNPVYQVACGQLHSVVLMLDGTIFFFGSGSDYRLPRFGRDTTKEDVGCPRKLEGLGKDTTGWSKSMIEKSLEARRNKAGAKREKDKHPKMPASCAAGGSNSAVVLHNGELWIWGANALASTADEPPENRDDEDAPKNVELSSKDVDIWVPQLLRKGFRALTVRTVSFGYAHALALTQESVLFAWGKGDAGQLGTGNLGTFDFPQMITNVTEVTSCSAGEEHSACIIEGGESYTWGKAAGGRLGLSATMNEGVQLLPELVVIDLPDTKDLRLKAIHCGSEHTSFISEDGRVLTCGVGWFGRLGQGTQDNSYSPRFVASSTLRASEVYSASYHTCIVDENRRLWMAGRDTSCCSQPGKHLLKPELFKPFDSPIKKYVYKLACCDAHTLVITSNKPGTQHGSELWVWGKNSKGQLGISEVQAPRIDLPWQLRLPGEGVAWHKFTNVATSTWHALVVVEGKGRAENHFEIYSWGFSGSGRLGHKMTEEYSTEVQVAGGHQLVRGPGVVDVRWRPRDQGIENSVFAEQDDMPYRSFADLLQAPSRTWLEVQQKLHQEDPDNKVEKLEEKGANVGNQYLDYMNDVLSLWDKPSIDSTRRTEYHLRRKRIEVESQYIRTLSVLSFKNSVHAPKIENIGKTEQEIRSKLHLFEELFWILQQQPLYLQRLSAHIGSKKREELEPIVFHRVIRQMFVDFSMSRTRTLFKALVRAIVKKEMQRAVSADDLFNPISSRSAPLFEQMATNPYYMHTLAKKILDPEDKSSLMHTIVHYTLSKDGQSLRNKEAWISGIFATNVIEYEMADMYYRELRGFGRRSEEELGKGRQYFQDELKDFAKLVNGLGGRDVPYDPNVHEDSMTDDELKERFANVPLMNKRAWYRMRKEKRLQASDRLNGPGGVAEEELYKRVMKVLHTADWENDLRAQLNMDAPFIKDFVSHFIKHVLGEKSKDSNSENRNEDFQMLFQHMFKHLTEQKYVIQYKSTTGNEWLPNLLQCMSSVVLGSVIGGVLSAVQTGSFTMWRMKIKKYVSDLEAEFLGEISKEALEFSRDAGLLEQVWWNVEKLALFFERCVHVHVYEHQVKDAKAKLKVSETEASQKFQQDATALQAAQDLKTFTCDVLLSVLQSAAGEETNKLFLKDETETELTVDLYMSHYDMRKSTVSIATSDMLHITNILHYNMVPDSRNPENQGVAIDTEQNCRLWKVVNKILPTEKNENTKTEKTVPWSLGAIKIAQEIGEMHNFTMRARFLEFKNTGMEEPTFCRETHVPIPRSLSNREQKKNLGLRRVVKPLRSNKGQEMEIDGQKVFPFQELMDLLEDLSGNAKGENSNPKVKYMLTGSTFQEMRLSFDDIQDTINIEMQNDAGNATNLASLLQRLEHAKTYVSRIRESTEEKDLRAFMDAEIKKRLEYNDYLSSLKQGMSKIQKAQEEYKKQLEETYKKLGKVNELTETCEMPEEITGAMQMNQQRAKFIDARSQKILMRKDRSNPSKLVLDELVRTTARDGGRVDIEKLKEMVGFPARQFNKTALERKGVLVQLNDVIPNNVRKQLMFSFQYENEGYIVRVFVKTTLLREFEISREGVQMLDSGLKNTVKSYGDDFLWFNCFRLRRLLAFIQAEGGL